MDARAFQQAGDPAVGVGNQKNLHGIGEHPQHLAHDSGGDDHRQIGPQTRVPALIENQRLGSLAGARADDLRRHGGQGQLLTEVEQSLEAPGLLGFVSKPLGFEPQLIHFAGKVLAFPTRLAQIQISVHHSLNPFREHAQPFLHRGHQKNGSVADQGNVGPPAELVGQERKLQEEHRRQDHQVAVAGKQRLKTSLPALPAGVPCHCMRNPFQAAGRGPRTKVPDSAQSTPGDPRDGRASREPSIERDFA